MSVSCFLLQYFSKNAKIEFIAFYACVIFLVENEWIHLSSHMVGIWYLIIQNKYKFYKPYINIVFN